MASRVLYLLGCAAPPVLRIAGVVDDAQRAGWDVCLGLTPTAAHWLADQLPALEQQSGHPVRSRYKLPGQPDAWPPATAALLAPATFNTVNQWALGITEKFVVGFAAEAIGKGIPLVTMPCVNAAYARHPQFARSVETLRRAGVRVLYGEGGFVPNAPGEGHPDAYPWGRALAATGEALESTGTPD
ncbi:flavoprotein [Streptomyces smyrnaeus]|uniref:flavoprotein n=1 Tax=Streptomyces TaxID=1883 RepID=UPI000C1A1295|nr:MULTISPECIES: flavoprotein [unclassified Streptomyces]MBQ0867684.1 flavoprotein [Streptomyces sp. RK75]MBQ1120480.1 flavoprotein [Streptomyces sp. B15]MBQ1160439.1 flavoprotein [Streptomyces sp. A73]